MQIKSLRPKSGRPSGGQRGHQGQTLKQVTHPDEVKHPSVSLCRHGGES